jgi:hypothetical protein
MFFISVSPKLNNSRVVLSLFFATRFFKINSGLNLRSGSFGCVIFWAIE